MLTLTFDAAFVGPRLIHTFTGDDKVCGVALLNNELFVLRDCRSDNQIDVYSTINFTFLRHLSINSQNSMTAIAACPQKRIIYVLNESEYGVHRLGLDGSECKWPLQTQPQTPLSLSVARTTHVLVLCTFVMDDKSEVDKLLFLSSENGECFRTITLQVDPDFVSFHCIHLQDDQYLLVSGCHEEGDNGRISLLDGDGKVLRSTEDEVPTPDAVPNIRGC